ncbi:hypothetical protein [uncultured Winogradskyella sp.]|uniref:hypothetical protein n=1 Tax=uncultured Winogradskyella sp. TaxID=395353 RepID=UPI00262AD766|nr:hypothetical protein [uncultured Winogradskyella sp.]
MIGPIGIYEEGRIIELEPGIHDIKILGSWLVSLDNFKIYFKEINSNKIICWKERTFRTNHYVSGKKAKVIADVDIDKRSKYSIHFENPSHIKVIFMGPFGLGILLNRKIPNSEIKISIGFSGY